MNDLEKQNKSLKAELAELAYWELQLDSIKKDCQKIVNYMWRDEYNDWEELDNPDDHIFHAVNSIKNWLGSQRRDNE